MGASSLRLDGRVAVVTGAGRGIGEACARRLAGAGASVVLADVTADAIGRLADELGDGARAVRVDVSRTDECTALADATREAFGGVDVVVTAAGITGPDTPALSLAPEDWERVLAVNLTGTLACLRALDEQLRPEASIVTISSGSIRHAVPGSAAYCVSKAGVWMLTRVLALELGERGIRVNCIAPGFIETPMTAPRLGDDRQRQRIERATPLHRVGQPDDVAGAVVFLASDEATFITGELFVVDGGLDAATRP